MVVHAGGRRQERGGRPVTPEAILRRVAADRRSGAAALARGAARAVVAWAEAPGAGGRPALRRLTRLLLRAQPAMAPFLRLANAVWLVAEAGGGPEEVAAAARAFARRLAAGTAAVAAAALPLVPRRGLVVTLSRSGAVLAALGRAAAAGRRVDVLCSEGRPAGEGLLLARALWRRGLAVRLVPDAALPGLVAGVQAVLVGADAVLPGAFVNKIGTFPLALAAHQARVPFYVLAEGAKFLPSALAARYAAPPADPRAGAPASRLFEATPLGWVTGLATEGGIVRPARLAERLGQVPVARAFRRAGGLGPPRRQC